MQALSPAPIRAPISLLEKAPEFQAPLREVNIDLDTALAKSYGWDIPVIFIGTHKASKHRVDIAQFRRQLQEAKRKL